MNYSDPGIDISKKTPFPHWGKDLNNLKLYTGKDVPKLRDKKGVFTTYKVYQNIFSRKRNRLVELKSS